jgi:hypothetical protein
MTWIGQRSDEEVAAAMRSALADYPPEYAPQKRGERRVPDSVKRDSIVGTHSLAPKVLEHLFAALREMFDPSLPLSRRQHETIATVVSVLNDCFY